MYNKKRCKDKVYLCNFKFFLRKSDFLLKENSVCPKN